MLHYRNYHWKLFFIILEESTSIPLNRVQAQFLFPYFSQFYHLFFFFLSFAFCSESKQRRWMQRKLLFVWYSFLFLSTIIVVSVCIHGYPVYGYHREREFFNVLAPYVCCENVLLFSFFKIIWIKFFVLDEIVSVCNDVNRKLSIHLSSGVGQEMKMEIYLYMFFVVFSFVFFLFINFFFFSAGNENERKNKTIKGEKVRKRIANFDTIAHTKRYA